MAYLVLALLVLEAVYGAQDTSLAPNTTAVDGGAVGRALDGTAVGKADGA